MAEAAKKIVESSGPEGVEKDETILCFWLTSKFRTELFFCFKKSSYSTPYLFHFSWKDRTTKSTAQRLHWVDSINNYTKMTFKGGGAGNISSTLRAALFWTGKWKPAFIPSDHCQISHSNKKYTLTCTPTQNNLLGESVFTWHVSESEVVVLNTDFKEKV